MQKRIPPLHCWLTSFEVVRFTGMKEVEIEAKLRILGIIPQVRKAANGWEGPHYPHFVVSLLKERTVTIPPAEDWRTANEIVALIRKRQLWITRRLAKYENEAEYRLDKQGRIRLHYPPPVVAALRQEAEAYPKAGRWRTINQMVKLTGKTRGWVENQIKDLKVQPEDRLGISGRVEPHYAPEVMREVRKRAKAIPRARGWYTARQLVRLTRKSRKWVKTRLANMEVRNEIRLAANGNACLHYHPSALKKLEALLY